ncbi:MAG: MarR family winged helix-turn-helix transcriptional regulator [Dehalococcoidia bacterium]
MPPPTQEPLGLQLSRVARQLQRAFDDALAEVGGSLPTWVVLATLKGLQHAMQRDLAVRAGIEPATMTHHLNRLEAAGFVVRTRSPENRRIQTVALTADGEALFARLVRAVIAFDSRLRQGLDEAETDAFRTTLDRLSANVAAITAAT